MLTGFSFFAVAISANTLPQIREVALQIGSKTTYALCPHGTEGTIYIDRSDSFKLCSILNRMIKVFLRGRLYVPNRPGGGIGGVQIARSRVGPQPSGPKCVGRDPGRATAWRAVVPGSGRRGTPVA